MNQDKQIMLMIKNDIFAIVHQFLFCPSIVTHYSPSDLPIDIHKCASLAILTQSR